MTRREHLNKMGWSRLSALFLIAALALLLTSGCSNSDGSDDNSPYATAKIPHNVNHEQYLANFPLLGSNRAEGPGVEPSTGKAPFGAIVRFLPNDYIGYCTTTHISQGRVVTNAHCVDTSLGMGDHYVVYYDKQGQKRVYPVASVDFLGSDQNTDIAVLRLYDESDANWDIAGNNVGTLGAIGVYPPESYNISVWAYDPIKNDASLYARYNRPGMMFTPRSCWASRTIPIVDGDNGSSSYVDLRPNRIDPNIHLFIDRCNKDIVTGNSGSLITLANDFNSKIGVEHWEYDAPSDASSTYYNFWYYGTRGAWDDLAAVNGTKFYFIGSAFKEFLQANSGKL